MSIMFDRRLVLHFDWGLLALTICLSVCGVGILYSAAHDGNASELMSLFYKQLIWYGLGFLFMIPILFFHYKHIDKWALFIYVFCIILLVLVHLVGKHVAGSTRWLSLGPFTLQPSEIAKLAVTIMLARIYSKNISVTGLTLRRLIMPMAVTSIPFILVATQPDLGTAGTIVLIAASMTLFIKIERKTFIGLLIVILLILPVSWQFLKPYQIERIMTLVSPERDPLGAGYHLRQSKIAIGSGQMFGKGYLQGTQKMLSFLPEQHTDFIFSVLAEEWGFAGSIMMLFLYLLLISFGVNIAHGCKDSFGTMLSVGIIAMLFWQVFINTAMIMGVLPVVGMPLPLVSYGGSSIITTLCGISILMNISMRRFLKE
jgi:rod shape determining protein RodA